MLYYKNMEHNSFTYLGKVLTRIIWDFLYFPLWWYGAGFLKTLRGVLNFYRGQEASLGFSIWLKNIFVPMYGQQDFTGRIISFFIRLIQVIYRGLVMLIIIVLGLMFIIFYLGLPIAIIIAILKQLD